MPVINKMTGMFVQIHLYKPQSLYNRDMSQTLSLYRLQQTDSQMDRVQARLLAIQKILEDDETLRQAGEQVKAADKQRLVTEQSLHQAEAAVQAQRVKIEQTESSLYGGSVHNPKELQDLQNDVAALKRHHVTLEDRLLEAMLASEAAETALQAARSLFEAAQKHMAEQKLTEKNVKPFDITGKPMMGWVMVAEAGWRNEPDMANWLDIGRRYALTLPKK